VSVEDEEAVEEPMVRRRQAELKDRRGDEKLKRGSRRRRGPEEEVQQHEDRGL